MNFFFIQINRAVLNKKKKRSVLMYAQNKKEEKEKPKQKIERKKNFKTDLSVFYVYT